ncbi:hypothetical protein HNP72_003371 [Sphingobacterium soli]|nr:hypothetical protein [Sphingobacterium soli]
MELSFQIEDLESIFRRLIDKHVAPMGLYVGECSLLQIFRPYGAVRWGMFVATDMPPLRGCTLVNGPCYKYAAPTGLVNTTRNVGRINETNCTGVLHTPSNDHSCFLELMFIKKACLEFQTGFFYVFI